MTVGAMTATPSPRWGALLKLFTAGSDAWLTRTGWNDMVTALETFGVVGTQGITSARPAASATAPRRVYFATDTGILSWDNGGTWVTIGLLGGVTPTGNYPGNTASEGTSIAGARADHTHYMPPTTIQSDTVVGVVQGSAGTANLTSAINVAAAPYPRILEARLRGMCSSQAARVQWQILNVTTSSVLKSGSATAPNNTVEVTFLELLPANTARSVRGFLVFDGQVNSAGDGLYAGFQVTTRPAGTP